MAQAKKKKSGAKKKSTTKKKAAKKKVTRKSASKKKTTAKKKKSPAKKKTVKKTAKKQTAGKKSTSKGKAAAAPSPIGEEIAQAYQQNDTDRSSPFPFEQAPAKRNYRLLFAVGVVVILALGWYFQDRNKQSDLDKLSKSQTKDAAAQLKKEPAKKAETGKDEGLVKEILYPGTKKVRMQIVCDDGDISDDCTLTRFYKNGQKESEEAYDNKMLNGLTTLYYQDGSIRSQRYWKDHKRDGGLINKDPKGKVTLECNYENGKTKDKGCPGGTPKIPTLDKITK